MKTNLVLSSVLIATAFLTSAAVAQTTIQTLAPATTASPASPTPAPNQTIYVPRLPSPAELTNVASAQGFTVDRIDQTNAQITVVYRYANGQTNTVAYQLLPAAGTAPAMPSTPAPVVTVPATTTVVYTAPAPTYYYYDPYYYPWRYWYPPVSLSFGFGYYHGGGGGFRGGGFHHR
jgi:hypothetical protein